MRRSTVLTVVATILLLACSEGSADRVRADRETDAAPRVGTSPAPAEVLGEQDASLGETADDGAPANGDGEGSAGGEDGSSGEQVNLPSVGGYEYEVVMQHDSGQERQAIHTTEVVEHRRVARGTEVVFRTKLDEEDDGMTTRVVFGSSGLVFLDDEECGFSRGDGTAGLTLVRYPLKPESYPEQHWNEEGCSGTLEVVVEGAEMVEAAGRTWRTWRIREAWPRRGVLHEQEAIVTRWLSTELGMDVREERRVRTAFGADGADTMNSRITKTLITHP